MGQDALNHGISYFRFYGEDATGSNGDYRAAGYTIELRDTGRYGFQLPPDQVHIQLKQCTEKFHP